MTMRPLQRFLTFLTLLGCFVPCSPISKATSARVPPSTMPKLHSKKKALRPSVRSCGHAIRWYTPGSRYVERSIHRLLRLAEISFDKGDWELRSLCLPTPLQRTSPLPMGCFNPFPKKPPNVATNLAILPQLSLPSPNTPSPHRTRHPPPTTPSSPSNIPTNPTPFFLRSPSSFFVCFPP